MKIKYAHAPGRGLMNKTAYELRMKYLSSLVDDINRKVASDSITLDQIQNNIESYIGTIEIPMGLVGPLLFLDDNESPEWVHTALATTEGALVASMNRGAKAISECGGFRAHIVHQKMLRTPMFTFNNMTEAVAFCAWIKKNFDHIREITKKHSNYAELLEISNIIVGKIAHLKFIYSTGDASGQNMTTSCTWHSCLWIEDQFYKETNIKILHFVIDGNGASDKKVSYYSILNGRGTHVISECFLTNEIIEKTLRTTADDMFRSFNHSMAISRIDGMIGYNVNVANAIAGIFGSTGQDLASINESSTAILQMEKNIDGLYLSLTLPSLVVGTVGGGTHLSVASKILELMDCKGTGKAGRFSKLIAGFALSIEISTLAAIVSGQFARAHQKHGRNRTENWLHKSEISQVFFEDNMVYLANKIKSVELKKNSVLDNGILMELTSKISNKVIGFIQSMVFLDNGAQIPVLLKSKALGKEVIAGLQFLASNLSSELSDALHEHQDSLEYKDCHLKEIEMYEALRGINYPYIPQYYGCKIDIEREIHLLFIEQLYEEELLLFNEENSPSNWTLELTKKAIEAIHVVHRNFANSRHMETIPSVIEIDACEAVNLYKIFTVINRRDYDFLGFDNHFIQMNEILSGWKDKKPIKKGALTVVHNDFNPRNVAVRKNGEICIYDWELASINLPQRDVFEFLAFTFADEVDEKLLFDLLHFHYDLILDFNGASYSWEDYLADFRVAGEEFLITRINFYLAGSTLINYPFIQRVFKNTMKMLAKLSDGSLWN